MTEKPLSFLLLSFAMHGSCGRKIQAHRAASEIYRKYCLPADATRIVSVDPTDAGAGILMAEMETKMHPEYESN